MEQNKHLPEIGYLFYYPQLEHPTDHFRLDVFVSNIATEKHFDVQSVRFHVKGDRQVVEHLTVGHPWASGKSAQVCTGKIIMEDRYGNKEEAFTFGGQLSIQEKEAQTVCTLISPAPILEINAATPMQKLFVDELEVLLAKERAAIADPFVYQKRICEADPFNLYEACFFTLVKKFETLPHKDELYNRFLFFLHSHAHRMEAAGLFGGYAQSLEEIFQG